MKKTYIIPTTDINIINIERMVAESPLTYDASQEFGQNDSADFGVKESTHSYNVWDDDWSK